MKCNRSRRHNDVQSKHARTHARAETVEAPVKLRGQGRSRDYCSCRAGAHYCPIVVAYHHARTQTLPHLRPSRPIPISHFATQLRFPPLHHKLHCASASASAQAALLASFSSRIPNPSLKAITSLLETFVCKDTAPTHRILHRSHRATNLHPGAHQDHQKTIVRHAS